MRAECIVTATVVSIVCSLHLGDVRVLILMALMSSPNICEMASCVVTC